jgi:hypothetical protein
MYVLGDTRTKIKLFNLYLDKNSSFKSGFLNECRDFLIPIKKGVGAVKIISDIFTQRNVMLGHNDRYEDTDSKVENLRKRAPKEIFEEIFGPEEAPYQPQNLREMAQFLHGVSADIHAIPVQEQLTYTYIREDGRQIKYYNPHCSLGNASQFASLVEHEDGPGRIEVKIDYLRNAPCTMIGLIKSDAQHKDELKEFYKLNPGVTPLNKINFDLPDIRNEFFASVQDEIRKRMRLNPPWMMYDANFGAFHAPTLQDLIQSYYFSIESALECNWFIFFHRPVNKEDFDFQEFFNRLGIQGTYFIRCEEHTEEEWKQLAEEKELERQSFWANGKMGPTGIESDKHNCESYAISAALNAKQRENGIIPPEQTYLSGELQRHEEFREQNPELFSDTLSSQRLYKYSRIDAPPHPMERVGSAIYSFLHPFQTVQRLMQDPPKEPPTTVYLDHKPHIEEVE